MAKINGSDIGTHACLHLMREYSNATVVVEEQHKTLSYTNSRGVPCWFNITDSTWYLIEPTLQEIPSLNPDGRTFIHRAHTVCPIRR